MSLEEQHQSLHRRGEMVKFLLLVLALVGTVLLIALLRPLIFERIVPAVLGLNEEAAPLPLPDTPPAAPPTTETESELPVIMTATPPADGETVDGSAADGSAADGGAGDNGGAPLPTPLMYEVQQGDTLVEIGEQFGVSVQALVQANGIANPNRILPGDVLVIPAP